MTFISISRLFFKASFIYIYFF